MYGLDADVGYEDLKSRVKEKVLMGSSFTFTLFATLYKLYLFTRNLRVVGKNKNSW